MYGTRRTHASCNLQIMRPSINFPLDNSTSTKNESSLSVLSQTWHKSGSCPKGTIPIRRISRQELLRATSLEHFGREGPRASSIVNSTNDKSSDNNGSKIQVFPPPNHSVIILYKSLLIDISVLSQTSFRYALVLMDTSTTQLNYTCFITCWIKYNLLS